MAKLLLKSIDYYPLELSSMPEAHKVLGRIDTDLPYKKLVIPTRVRQLYRLVDESTGQVLKQQKLVRDLNDLKIYVGQVIVVELKDFFSFQHALAEQTSDQPLYMVDAGETSCVAGLITPKDASTLPELYVLWEPGMSVANCLNPQAMALQPFAGLGGISGVTLSSLSGVAAAVGLSSLSSAQSSGTASVVYPKLSGSIFQGPVIGQLNNTVSGLKVQAFDSSGKSLGIADVKADGSYELTLTDAAYTGALVLKVYDDSTDKVTPKFRDEATGKEKTFTTLLAVINYQGNATTTTTVNVTALTNLAAVKAGITVTDTYTDTTTGNDVSAIQDVAGNDLGNMVLGAWTNDILSASQSAFTAGKTVLVVGGQGNDTMTGGLANDTFTWFAGDAGATGAVDVVKSFSTWNGSAGDKLDISKLLTGYAGGTNLSQWVTSVTTAQTSPAGVTGSTKIVIDTDGPGSTGAIQTIWLEGVNLTLSGDTLEAQLAALKTSGVLIA